MAAVVLNSERHIPPKKKKSKNKSLMEEDEPSSSNNNERRKATRASFDHILKQAVEESRKENEKPKKNKKKKPVADSMLEKLRKGEGLVKDEDDATLLANTFDPDDEKGLKSNKRREREMKQRNGIHNLGYDKEEVVSVQKPKKKKTAKQIQNNEEGDRTMYIDDLAPLANESPVAPQRKKKKKKMQPEIAEVDEQEDDTDMYRGDNMDQSEDRLTPDDPEESKPKVKKKKKKKKAMEEEVLEEAVEADEQASASPSPCHIEDDGRIIAIVVHRTDKLKTDFFISHPLVRISIVDLNTGNYLKKQTSSRPVTSFYETQRVEEDGRQLDFIQPIMTQPFDFKRRKSTLPVWEEVIIFNENFNYIIQTDPKVVIFFELLDFVSMNTAKVKYNTAKQEGGWHRIAWGFLQVLGANGQPNTGHKIRLQLYQPPFRSKPKEGSLEIFQWWRNNQRLAYPSTLYITLKGITPPENIEPAHRSMFATQEERGRMTYDDLQRTAEFGETLRDDVKGKGPSLWTRLPGQVCRVPNTMMLSLPAGGKGCFVVRFSHDGRSLACAGHDRDSYPIYIYEIPSGKLKGQFLGHYSLVYDLSWSRNNKQLLSACADGTARLWDTVALVSTPVKVMPHPTFVYAAQFHPRVSKITVTGCYDRVIRVWTIQGDEVSAKLLQEIEGHQSHVNSLCFDPEDGSKMYSGDGQGCICVWNAYVTDQPSKNGFLRDWTLNQEINDEEIKGVSINYLKVHPNGGRLLIHTRDNKVRMFDLRRSGIMVKYQGAVNMRERLRSTITPCGSFVVAGSEDNAAYVWRAETGDQVASYLSLGYKTAVVDVDFHPHDNILAMCSFSDSHPVLIYKFDLKMAQRELGIETLEPMDTTRSIKRTGRPGSPEMRQYEESEEEGMETARSNKMVTTREDFRAQEKARLQRVQRKLDAINAYISPQPTNTSYAESPMPSFFSPHASRTLQSSIQQQQFDSQRDYMKESASGWRPSFSPMGRPPANISSPSFMQKPSQSHLSLQSTSSRPQFSFQAAGGVQVSRFQSKHLDVVVALYDYQAQRSDELSFFRGDILTVLHKDNDNWWMGEAADGTQGYFPANYVTTATDEDIDAEEKADDSDVRGSRTHALVSKSGELKFVSEDSDLESMPRKVKKKKKKTVSLSQDTMLSIEDESPAPSLPGRKKKIRGLAHMEESQA